MDAILKIEVGVQPLMALADKYAKAMTDFTTDHAESFWQERDALLTAIREVLQTLASKEAEIARLKSALGELLICIDEPATGAVGLERELRRINNARAAITQPPKE